MADRRVEKWTRKSSMAREFAADLGDARRNRRAQQVGLALVRKPELSLPKVFADEAQLQAVYDLLGNDAVAWRDVVKPHIERTHERARDAGDVLAVHDTTDVAFRLYWPDEQRQDMISMSTRTQGFFLHTSLCVTASGPVLPLGVLDLQPYVNRKKLEASRAETQQFWAMEAGVFDNEQERWFRSVAVADDDLAWHHLLTPLEFRILQRMLPKFKLTKAATVAQCFLAIARLGGHLKRNGPPGWQTLHAGWARLQELSLGAKVGGRDAINL